MQGFRERAAGSGGVAASGGTLSNLMALVTARRAAAPPSHAAAPPAAPPSLPAFSNVQAVQGQGLGGKAGAGRGGQGPCALSHAATSSCRAAFTAASSPSRSALRARVEESSGRPGPSSTSGQASALPMANSTLALFQLEFLYFGSLPLALPLPVPVAVPLAVPLKKNPSPPPPAAGGWLAGG
jgi:hypothetical protein